METIYDNLPSSLTNDGLKNIWADVMKYLCEDMGTTTANLWFGHLNLCDIGEGGEGEENAVVFKSEESNLIKKAIEYMPRIEKGFSEVAGFTPKIIIKDTKKEKYIEKMRLIDHYMDEEDRLAEEDRRKRAQGKIGSTMPTVNFEYTFDNFIEGSSNKFARAACLAVAQTAAEAPDGRTASQYNPLFLHGPSGIGKTHLMYAISNKVNQENPDAVIIYIKSEDFTNQLIDSLTKQKMNEFREKYRKCDVLMIDDIQFIAGKVSTQEEFFHTFNALYESDKQIIMTSDRPPREIPDLETRLLSRFEFGLLADIQPPDLELRVAIIKKKAEQVGLVIPDDVLSFLAENLRSNIRQIEGAIKKLSAISLLSGEKITIETAKNLITELLGGAEPINVTVDKIFLAVYKKYGVKKEELIGTVRKKEISFARHVAIYLIRNITEMSLPNIGKIFGRDHTTILASIKFVEKKLITDNMFGMELDEIKKSVETGNI